MIKKIKALVLSDKKIIVCAIVIMAVFSAICWKKADIKDSDSHENWVILRPHLAQLSIHKYGKITTGNNISITAPFAGKIISMYYVLGEKITKGQPLIKLSTDKITKQLHDTQSDYLKKSAEYNKYLHWNDSADVQKAKQSLIDAQQQFKLAQEKLTDSTFLYQKGIISKDELNEQKQVIQQSKEAIDSAKFSLADTLKQGDKDNLTIVKLAMEDSRNMLNTIQNQIKRATIVSPATGIVLKPHQQDDKSSVAELTIGEEVTENQNLLSIGNSDNLEVKSSLNQSEINQIKPDMPVTINSDAFPGITLTGKITSISRLADENISSTPTFPFTVTLGKIGENERKAMRIGLMVDITIETYRRPNTLIVPVTAVNKEGKKNYVWLKKEAQTPLKQYVTIGPTLPDGIVILTGLKPGDQIKVYQDDST